MSRDDVMPGRFARFVKWVHRADGWEPQYLRGRVLRKTDGAWIVAVDGEETRVMKQEWSVYR
ncbi:hypothetical protein HQQ82_12535 [Rathayibacter sp. VKM Ac-2856]|uniref:hypothetical protein n=1 Tax=unclassified Rathayibacter TaxID=2609250 RepID=UPI0015633077|nr:MULTISPECIES: hypothetical protein [unclassified Rathayibacter]NQX05321.1 hypothetical protein [Rathayibacter sp. VKM Ac-2858]NQX20804.1 hypothetical protein [Rathayibacter sp. VKM Ac-2856]